MIGSLSTLGNSSSTSWVNHNFHTYVVLKEGTDPEEFEDRLYDMVVKYVGPMVVQFMGIDLDQFEAAGHSYGYRLQKLTDIHLHSNLQYELEPNGNPHVCLYIPGGSHSDPGDCRDQFYEPGHRTIYCQGQGSWIAQR